MSGALALIFSFAFLAGSTFFRHGIYSLDSDPLFLVSIALSVPMLAYGSFDYVAVQRVYKAERKVPDLLRDLSNFTSFGVPLAQAFQRVNMNSYGSLTPGVRKVASLVSSGVGFEEAIQNLGDGLNSPKIALVSKILQKSNESGSNTSDVIWILSEFTTRSDLLRESRIAEMKNYNWVMIISFAVFLFVILFLDMRFLQIMFQHTIATGSFVAGNISSANIERAFSVGVIAQALAIGVISGILRDVRFSSGVLLSGVLVAVTTVVFLAAGVY